MTDPEWQAEVKGPLKAEMKRRGLTYGQLAGKRGGIGVEADPHVLRTKVARGGFSAVFPVQCLRAMGARSVQLQANDGQFSISEMRPPKLSSPPGR